jgi:hypothetical protein
MKLVQAFDNLAKFFKDDETRASIPAEAFKNKAGDVIEIRIYNAEYEELLILDRHAKVQALSVSEYESKIKFKA